MAVRPVDLRYGKTLKGGYFGGIKGRTQPPRIVDWCMQGKIVVDELITELLPLEQVNLAFERMRRGRRFGRCWCFDPRSG